MAGEVYVMGLFGYQKCRRQPNDLYFTPDDIARKVVEHFKPRGRILEPCAGEGAFLKYLPQNTHWCEIEKGKNFFAYRRRVNWIVTNPPFSKLTAFLSHSMKISNNIVFVINLPGLFTVKRVREIRQCGFGIKEIYYLKQPDTWTQTGRQLAAVWLKKYHFGFCRFIFDKDLNKPYKNKVKCATT